MSQAPQIAAPVAHQEPADPRWLAAVRVTSSRTFERCHRLQAFLLDVARHAVAGRTDKINEQQIGVRVFEKPPNYNPAEDNTVRVQARLLRLKLDEYYHSEGASDPLRIQIPKGGYIPLFVPAVEEAAPVPAPPAPAIEPAVPPAPPINRILAAVCVVLLCLCVVEWWQKRGLEHALKPSVSADFGPLTSLVAGPAKRTVVVLADSGLVVAEALTHQEIPLADYSGSGYRHKIQANQPQGFETGFWGYLLSRRYTSMADVGFYGKLLQLHPDAWKTMEVRHARDLQVRDFRGDNFILLGSNRSTPWIELFEDKLNFQFDSAPATGLAMIRNKHPQPGELPAYVSDAMPNGAGNGYALIAYIPNLTETGGVLLIGGTTMAATDAAAEFACDPRAVRTLKELWGLADLRGVKAFELVYATAIVSDTVKSVRLLTSRHTLRKSS